MPYATPQTLVSLPKELTDELKATVCKPWGEDADTQLPVTVAVRKAVREFIDNYKQGEKQ